MVPNAYADVDSRQNDSARIDYRHEAFDGKRNFCRHLRGKTFTQTDLFFGLSRRDGPNVTEQQFQDFVDAEVTRRFPGGLTLLAATGQFRGAGGGVIKEGSKVLVLLYSFNEGSDQSIEDIRKAYVDRFAQESVLRVDEPSCVSF